MTVAALVIGGAYSGTAYAGSTQVWPSATAPPFNPATIAGLKLWFDAAELGLADGALVSSWTDKSGQGYHLVGTGAQRPTYRTNVRNGKSVLRFDGTGNYLQQSIAYTTVGHVFVAATWTGGAAFPDYNGLVTGTSELLLLGTAGGTTWYDAGNVHHYNGTLNPGRTAPMGVWAVMGVSRATAYTSFAMVVGLDRGSYPPRYWWGDVGEVIAYDHLLSDADRIQVETYLMANWG